MNAKNEHMNKFANGVLFLMLGQTLSKGVNFLLNTLLVRYLSPRIFGITSFLEFLLSTVLFFSRESIRISTLRIKSTTDSGKLEKVEDGEDTRTLQSLINFGYIPFVIGLPLSIILISWQYSNLNSYFIDLPYFRASIFLIWLSILIELLSEPFYLVHQYLLNHFIRSKYESLGVTFACVANFIIVVWFEKMVNGVGLELHDDYKQEGIAIFAFAVGKLVHAMTLLACYSYNYYSEVYTTGERYSYKLTKIRPETRQESYYFQNDTVQHFKKVYFQLCFKHLLTEGDKLIINSLCTVEEQGIYSLLSNYGSLITRLLFAPIEEALRLFLARLLSVSSKKNLWLSMKVLIDLTKFYLYLSLFIIIFGPINSSYLLKFVIGSKWSSTSFLETIRTYCFYIPFLSLNGIFEAFFQSVASGDQIFKHSYVMMLFSGIFLFNCWLFIEYFDLSLEGLIVSNILNMALRIAYCGNFIHKFYHYLLKESSTETTQSILPNISTFKNVALIAVIIGALDWYFIGYVENMQELLINVILAVLLLILVIYKEKSLISELLAAKSYAA
ncbi:Rft1 [Kluyveromyces lactis]|nr:Rft1 [Kluyveromyces lactis]